MLLVVVAAGMSGRSEGDSGNDAVDGTVSSLSVPVADSVTTSAPVVTVDTTAVPVVKTTFAQPLAMGAAGDDVKQL